MDNSDTRLIVYGSLAPGGPNAFLLGALEGDWHKCVIHGHMGRYRGFKSFRYDPQGPEHRAWLLESAALPGIYPDLDDFEGEEYQRILIPARVASRWLLAHIYEGRSFD